MVLFSLKLCIARSVIKEYMTQAHSADAKQKFKLVSKERTIVELNTKTVNLEDSLAFEKGVNQSNTKKLLELSKEAAKLRKELAQA
jgi:hypothetical protein